MRHLPIVLSVACLFAGCSGDVGLSTSTGDSSGEFAGDEGAVGLATSDYVVLDIATGALTARAAPPDLGGSAVRQGQIVFRRIDNRYLIGVFEVTQAQWTALGGTTPWTAAPAAVVGAAAVDPEFPAFGLSYDEIDATLDAYRSATGVTLGFPTGSEWREACDTGGSNYHWGNSELRTTVATYALTADTADGVLGPTRVGSAASNGSGLFDVHGNLWEWTDDGTVLRGGSWRDPTYAARVGHAVDAATTGLYDDSAHALTGLRLVLRP